MPGSVSRDLRQWRWPVQPVSTAPRRGCRRQPLPAGPRAALEEGDNEREADPRKPAGGLLDAGCHSIWKNYKWDHFLHPEFKMLIPVASVKKQTSWLNQEKSGETSVMRKHMTKEKKY